MPQKSVAIYIETSGLAGIAKRVELLPSPKQIIRTTDKGVPELYNHKLNENQIFLGNGDNDPTPLTFTANTLLARSSSGDVGLKPITDFILTLIDDEDWIEALATLNAQGRTVVSTSNPTVGDDEVDGYHEGYFWYNELTGDVFICKDATTGAADWVVVNKQVTWLEACRVASTANVNISSAPASIDGITLSQDDRVLLKNQTAGAENGIYVFNGAGSAMTRATDFDEDYEAEAAVTLLVQEGDTQADTFWVLTTDLPITIGTTALTFVRYALNPLATKQVFVDGALGNDTIARVNDPNRPFATISAAITAASAGDKIVIAPGAYAEALTINKDLHFDGEGVTGITDIDLSSASAYGRIGMFEFGENFIKIFSTDSGATNGANYLIAQAAARTMTPYGAALSDANRVNLIPVSGTFTFSAHVLHYDFINVIGEGNPRIEASGYSFPHYIGGDGVPDKTRYEGLDITCSSMNYSGSMEIYNCKVTGMVQSYQTATWTGVIDNLIVSRLTFGDTSSTSTGTIRNVLQDSSLAGAAANYCYGFAGDISDCIFENGLQLNATCVISGNFQNVRASYMTFITGCSITGTFQNVKSSSLGTSSNARVAGTLKDCYLEGLAGGGTGGLISTSTFVADNCRFANLWGGQSNGTGLAQYEGLFMACFFNLSSITPEASRDAIIKAKFVGCVFYGGSDGRESGMPAADDASFIKCAWTNFEDATPDEAYTELFGRDILHRFGHASTGWVYDHTANKLTIALNAQPTKNWDGGSETKFTDTETFVARITQAAGTGAGDDMTALEGLVVTFTVVDDTGSSGNWLLESTDASLDTALGAPGSNLTTGGASNTGLIAIAADITVKNCEFDIGIEPELTNVALASKTKSVSADHVVSFGEKALFVDASAASRSVTLLPAKVQEEIYIYASDTNSGANTITIYADDGTTSVATLTADDKWVRVVGDSANYKPLGN